MRSQLPFAEALEGAIHKAAPGSARHAVLCRMGGLHQALSDLKADPDTPARVRAKGQALLAHIDAQHEALGSRMFHPTFAINVVGEGMARADFVHRSVVEFLQIALYFFGLEEIDRRWPARASAYGEVHADHLTAFLARGNVKDMLEEGRGRIEEGRIFCLTYRYLNDLRKAYWAHCRASEDVLDVAISAEGLKAEMPSGEGFDPEALFDEPLVGDRVQLMLDIFSRGLNERQRWIYLAKNRASLLKDLRQEEAQVADPFEALWAGLGEPGPEDDLGWAEIADQLGIHEKTAKREYLRALLVILRESARAVFGDAEIPSRYVRRILDTIREVVEQRDLRLRQNTGRGLNTLVEKWEVALRFVLNHERVPA